MLIAAQLRIQDSYSGDSLYANRDYRYNFRKCQFSKFCRNYFVGTTTFLKLKMFWCFSDADIMHIKYTIKMFEHFQWNGKKIQGNTFFLKN